MKPNEPSQLTVEDMLRLKPKFMTIISRYQISSMSVEDVLSEFFVKMLRPSQKDGKNYLQRYDGSTALSTWFYRPLQNMCNTMKTRENSRGGRAITKAARIEEAPEKEVDFDGTTLYLENFESNGQLDMAAYLMGRQILRIAKDKYSSFSSLSETGIERSIFKMLFFLYNGLNKAQVARVLQVSTTFVDQKIKEFLKDSEVQAIRREYFQDRRELAVQHVFVSAEKKGFVLDELPW